MYALVDKPMSFEEFLTWNDNSGRSFELIDGFPMPITEPNAKHENVVFNLCVALVSHCVETGLPYVPRMAKQVRLPQNPSGREESRKADIVIFSRAEWDRMESSSSSAAAYVPPPAVIEVVSTNWRDDYIAKLDEYEALGILEFWTVDYAGLGGVRFIGSPKQPTLTIYNLLNGEYQPSQFRGDERIISQIFPNIPLTAAQVFNMAKS